MDSRPDITVVIPARNEGRAVLSAVESIVRGRSTRFPLEVIVVDDASDDGSCQVLHSREKQWISSGAVVRVIRVQRWSGIPFCRNIGAFSARGANLFITDANVLFPANWDLPIRHAIRPSTVLCAAVADMGSRFVGYGCVLQIPSMTVRWIRSPYQFGGYVPISPCSATIISADLFRRLGGYDTKMPLYGAAEPEFSVRLWLSGATIVSQPQLVLRHRFRPKRKHSEFLSTIHEILVRNYLRFGLLYLDPPTATRMLKYYADRNPRVFRDLLSAAVQTGVWERRQELKSLLKVDFSYYKQRFAEAR
jgi:glycosyltransferase involved in cell wall biosynthesis